jgi:D-beta-D-heptose 7-phosphate kinase/D-beta-D-heptose 1-phosphate adenosyltransferase
MAYRRPKVLVLGDTLLDLWVQALPRQANPEGAALIACGKSDERQATIGGAGLVATLLYSLGMRVKLMSRLGDDAPGATVHSLLHEFGLSCKNIKFSSTFLTPAKMRFVNDHGIVAFRYDEEETAEQYLTHKSRDFDFERYNEHIQRANMLVVADYGKGYCQFHGKKIIDAARYYGVLSVVGAKPAVLNAYRGADVVKLNSAEAKEYLELNNVAWSPDKHETAQCVLQTADAHLVVITAGRNGTIYAVRQADGSIKTYHGPAKACFPAVANCVGAGDAFLAGMVGELTLPPKLKGPPGDARVHQTIAAASSVAAQYLNRGFPMVDPAVPYLASYAKRTETSTALKVLSFDEATALCSAWRSIGDTIVFTNGCFDLLHYGHVSLLEQAKQQGKKLIVAVNGDMSVRLLKGPKRPVQDFKTRSQVIAGLGCVDAVVMLDEEDFAAQPALRAMLTTFVPDVLVKGAQYKEEEIVGFEEMVNRDSPGRVWRCPMVDGISTTQVLERMQNAQ